QPGGEQAEDAHEVLAVAEEPFHVVTVRPAAGEMNGSNGPKRPGRSPQAARAPSAVGHRERTLAFWAAHRAAMHALKFERDHGKAAGLFRRALALNPGALLLLGEIALLRGDEVAATERLEAVCRTNPRAAGGLFLLGYLRWRQGDSAGARDRLRQARAALGPD
ncbi:MAG TPA: hypothetical protein VMT87_09800, partial [Vicinamibacteria bacterium]|nr:hypothetical protein [Vicinamibacteria bacterium]